MTANQRNTSQDSQQALQQAFRAPMEQSLQMQKSAAEMFMNSMEMGYWAQNQGIDLTRNLFQNYIDTVEDAVRSTEQIAEQGIEMQQATMQPQAFQPFQQQGQFQRPPQQQYQQQPQQYQQPQGQQYQQPPTRPKQQQGFQRSQSPPPQFRQQSPRGTEGTRGFQGDATQDTASAGENMREEPPAETDSLAGDQ